jgi:DNA repair exonuclease SbcCD nuclease subunit
MTHFSFLTANDIHISDNGPRSRIDDFKATVLGKISQIRMAANKLCVDATLLAGDLFNLKNPAKNSHNLNQELIKEFKQFKSPIYMIEGNHDLTGNNINSLPDQPLGVLFEDKTLIQLREQIVEKDGVKVSIVGLPYTDFEDLSELKIPEKGRCALQICLLHLYAAPVPGMLFRERIYGYKELAEAFPSVDVFVIGHYHLDQGVETTEGKYFINLGSITRGTLADEDVNHKPKIGLIQVTVDDAQGRVVCEIKTIALKIKPVEEVFDLERHEEEKKEVAEIEAFVEKMMTAMPVGVLPDINTALNSMEMAKTVRDKVLHFLHEAKAT